MYFIPTHFLLVVHFNFFTTHSQTENYSKHIVTSRNKRHDPIHSQQRDRGQRGPQIYIPVNF